MNRIKLLLNVALITFLFWPQTSGISQQQPGKSVEQENKELSNALKNGLIQIANNNDTISAAIKSNTQEQEQKVIVKKVITKVPVFKTVVKEKPVYVSVYKDTLYVSNGVSTEKPVIIYRAAPVYKGDYDKFDSTKTTSPGPLSGWKPFKFLKRKR